MTREEIIRWLREDDETKLDELWRRADDLRRANVGDAVHLRGLVEFSNRCSRQCLYCGLRAGNAALTRYRMEPEEILACARKAVELGYGTLVMQSGEDAAMDPRWLADVIARVKAQTPLAVTLSVGEWPREALELWRRAGADRFLLRFETADEELLRRIHPSRTGQTLGRLDVLRLAREAGFEIGSGILIGVPGQTYHDLARGIGMLAELDLDMIGCGPFIANPHTPLGDVRCPVSRRDPRTRAGAKRRTNQVPGTPEMTYKVVALARIACPLSNIPGTTALATLDRRSGYELALARGANVIMPNLTPANYRRLYELYPGKMWADDDEAYHGAMKRRIEAAGRTVGTGRGDSPHRLAARASGT